MTREHLTPWSRRRRDRSRGFAARGLGPGLAYVSNRFERSERRRAKRALAVGDQPPPIRHRNSAKWLLA